MADPFARSDKILFKRWAIDGITQQHRGVPTSMVKNVR